MTQRQRLGKLGEELARRHLESSDFAILHTNYRTNSGEIDIVAQKDNVLVFVEVRTRRGNSFGTPEESITPLKQAHMATSAQEYIQEHQDEDREWRLDIAAVELDRHGKLLRVDIIENAVEL